ncbi:5660_t:CDS:2 [Funneliformis mosseae]|uniref:5660_t:CDS:1 n=1 Tax=Funneliformis mosseae TaxID=27381 RepID=A0A9N9D9U2_FUNMO|nr:5660_t:CDS:2 [Funneliformis mosseae]
MSNYCNHYKDVAIFWNNIEDDLANIAIKSATYFVMQNTATILQTAISRSDATYYTVILICQNLSLELLENIDNLFSFYETPSVYKQLETSLLISYSQNRKHDHKPEDDYDTKEKMTQIKLLLEGKIFLRLLIILIFEKN